MSTRFELRNITDQNALLDTFLRRSLNVDLKTYKILKNGAISLALLAFGVYLISEGVDPTLVASTVLPIIALLNGLEMSELYAAWAEVKAQQAQQSEAAADRPEE